MKFMTASITCFLLLSSGAAWAAGGGYGRHDSARSAATLGVVQVAQADMAAMSEGEVRKIDKENKKITLRHGEIKSLDMPRMTMVFQVKDAAMLDKLKSGDKVRFSAEELDGGLVVTRIEPAK